LMASSKLVSDVALSSVTRATLIYVSSSLNPSLLLIYPIYGPTEQMPNMRPEPHSVRTSAKLIIHR
jgi:hypothetical protein